MEPILNFFETQYTFSVSGLALLLIGVIGIIGIVTIAAWIFSLLKRLRESQSPKFGFLGKPLYQFALVSLIVGGIVISSYTATQNSNVENTKASEEIKINYEQILIESRESTSIVSFNIIPLINEKPWGEKIDREFDIYINLVSTRNYTFVMNDKTQITQANYQAEVEKGTYQAKITVISGESVNYIERVIIVD